MKNNPSDIVRICAWCPDKEEKEKRAERENKAVSHGICTECAEKYF